MLHLADAFGFGDEVKCIDLCCPYPTLIDDNDPRLKFTPQEIADTVRKTANEIFQVFYQHIESSATLSVVQKTIALVMPNSAEIAFSVLAISGLSMISCPMYTTLSAYEFRQIMKDSGVSLLIIAGGPQPGAEKAAAQLNIPCARFTWDFKGDKPIPLVGFEDHTEPSPMSAEMHIIPKEFEHCIKFSTAGVVREPKLMSLTHRNMALSLANIQKTYAWRGYFGEGCELEDIDVGVCVAPLYHVHGLVAGCLAPLAAQSVVIIARNQFDPSTFWKLMKEYNGNWSTLVPSELEALVDTFDVYYPKKQSERPDVHFLRTTSEMLRTDLASRAEDLFNTLVLHAYALTEASHQICSNGYPTLEDRVMGSVGKPTGTEVCVLTPNKKVVPIGQAGEVWVRGFNVIEAYENLPADEQCEFFCHHNEIDWMCTAGAPSYCSAAFDISSGVYRAHSSGELGSGFSGGLSRGRMVPPPAVADLPPELRPPPSPLSTSPGMPSPIPTPQILGKALSRVRKSVREPVSAMEAQQLDKCGYRGFTRLMRYASALEPYLNQEFPNRMEPLISPLPLHMEWLKTGDTGRMDEHGRLFLIARNQDVINRGGAKVGALEIELVYKQFPEITECAAFGVQQRGGEAIHIAVVLNPEFSGADRDELEIDFKDRAKDQLAKFKIPSQVRWVQAIPRDTDGRLQRRLLAAQLSG